MPEPLHRWDYQIEPDLTRLSRLAEAGWELSMIDEGEKQYIFRRPVRSFVERVTLEQRRSYYLSRGLDPDLDS